MAWAQSPVRVTDSFSPQNGSGGSQVFTFAFSDSKGYQDLFLDSRILFSSGAGSSGSNFCWVGVGQSGISLAPDDLSRSWSGVSYSSNAVAQNSQCTINGAGTTISGSGNTLTVNLSVTFHISYAGLKTVYTNVNSLNDYVAVGTYNVTPTSPDFTLSMSPASQSVQSGQSATYTVTVSPLNGFNQNITLSLNPLSSGVSGTLTPSVITGGSGTSTLTITTSTSTPTSTWNLAITATSPTLTHASATLAQLVVTAPAPPPPPVRTTDSVSPQNGSGGGQVFTFVFSDSKGYQDLFLDSRILFSSGAGSSGSNFCWVGVGPSGISLAPDDLTRSWSGVSYSSNAVAQNSQCTINGAGTTISGSGNTLTVNLSVTFHISYAGLKTVYTNVNSVNDYVAVGTYNVTATSPDFTLSISPASQSVQAGQSATYTVTASPLNGFNQNITLSLNPLSSGVSGTLTPSVITGGSGTSTLTITTSTSTPTSTWNLAITGTSPTVTHAPATQAQLMVTGTPPPPPPVRTTDSVAPQNGSGGGQVFTFVFSDSKGYQDLFLDSRILFSSGAGSSGSNFCWVGVGSSGISLAPDDLSRSWSGVSYGSNAVVQNSQCTINGVGTTISGSGNTLTVNLSITFHVSYAGLKTVYTNVNSVNDYVAVGTYNVTATSPDFILSISPAFQSVQAGQSATYTVTASPLNGFNQNITLSLNPLSSGVSGTLTPSVITGGSGTSTLTITTSTSTPASTWNLAITATSATVTHAPATQAQLVVTGTPPPPPPTISTDSVSPQNGSGPSQVFTFQFSDSSGYRDLLGGKYHVLINAAVDGRNSCWLQLLTTGLNLANDDPNGNWSFVPYGTSTTAQNSQCIVNGVGTNISGSGNSLTLSLSLTFTAAYRGTKNVYTDVNASAPNYGAVASYTVQ